MQSWVVEAGSDIENVADGLLSAISTLTTVGCGDRFPTSPLGRRIAVALMLSAWAFSTCSPRRLCRSTLSEGERDRSRTRTCVRSLSDSHGIERQLDQQSAPD